MSPSLSLLSPAAALRRSLALALGHQSRAAFARASTRTPTAAAAAAAAAPAVHTTRPRARALHTTTAVRTDARPVPAASAVQTDPADSTTPAPASPPRKRKPNPYRLPPLHDFRTAFKPLHDAGWALTRLAPPDRPPPTKPSGDQHATGAPAPHLRAPADLQDHWLRRAYAFPGTKAGWRALARAAQRVMEAAEAEDHHPVIEMSASTDALAATATPRHTTRTGPHTAGPAEPTPPGAPGAEAPLRYVLSISTHTHTPMPPLEDAGGGAVSTGADGTEHAGGLLPRARFQGRPRPGVTTKDLRLAERVERLVAAEGGTELGTGRRAESVEDGAWEG